MTEGTAADRACGEWGKYGTWCGVHQADRVPRCVVAENAPVAVLEQTISELRDSAKFLTDGIDELIRERDEHERQCDAAQARVATLESALRQALRDGFQSIQSVNNATGLTMLAVPGDYLAKMQAALAPDAGGV
jgi:hypothetical protein